MVTRWRTRKKSPAPSLILHDLNWIKPLKASKYSNTSLWALNKKWYCLNIFKHSTKTDIWKILLLYSFFQLRKQNVVFIHLKSNLEDNPVQHPPNGETGHLKHPQIAKIKTSESGLRYCSISDEAHLWLRRSCYVYKHADEYEHMSY